MYDHLEIVRTLWAEAQTLQPETDAGLAMAINVLLLVALLPLQSKTRPQLNTKFIGNQARHANLATNPARVTPRLCADGAFRLGRSGPFRWRGFVGGHGQIRAVKEARECKMGCAAVLGGCGSEGGS
jgi:hypothetical protein